MTNRSNVMGLHGLKNKPSRNSFDVSARNLFTAKVGELLPCAVYEMNPGDSIKIDASYFTRTAPLQTAAFTRLRENVQFFFVPYSQLWKFFNTQVLNMTKSAGGSDVSRIATSPFDNQKVTTSMPYVSTSALHKYLVDMMYSMNHINDDHDGSSIALSDTSTPRFFNNGEYRYAASSKLLQMLGYGNFPYQVSDYSKYVSPVGQYSDLTAPNLSIFRLLAYQKICNDHYQFRQWQGYDASLCNIDYVTPESNMSFDTQLENIDFLTENAKSSRPNFLDMRFSNLPLDYLNGVLPTAQFGSESVVSLGDVTSSGGSLGTLDVKKTNVLNSLSGAVMSLSVDPNSTPFQFDQKVSASNPMVIGALNPDGTASGMKTKTAGGGYANLTGLNITGSVSTSGQGSQTSVVSDVSLSGGSSGSVSGSASLSMAALRQAYAAQKYKEVQLANDVDFVSQIEAHFGVKPKCDNDTSRFIGGASSMIDINPIVNTNLSGDNQAQYKASPIGHGSSKIKFTADTYGVVMGIYRCTPVLDYAHIGIDKQLCKTDATDFVIPEMDSIGMQQNYVFELRSPCYSDTNKADSRDYTKSYGYAPRYAEYKTNFDKVNGDFCYSLKNWVTGLSDDQIAIVLSYTFNDNKLGDIAPELFNCRPDIVNSIFLNQRNLLTSDDKLYVGMVNMAFVTRNLSRYGLPYSN